MENFVTLFDSKFLPQGMALYASMRRHIDEFTLWIICVDDICFNILHKVNKPYIKLIRLADVETQELKMVRGERTVAEYCWTLTPFSPQFVFQQEPTLSRITYLDADLWFRDSPSLIFKEFIESNKSVLITEHAFSAEYDQSDVSGKFCVQFIIFEKKNSNEIIKWWQRECIKWCYARVEDGKFGDQKYLEQWSRLFPDHVHILKNKEFFLAPWNASRFPYSSSICWHFHQFRVVYASSKRYIFEYGNYYLPRVVRQNIYAEYIKDIKICISMLIDNGWVLNPQFKKYIFFIYLKSFYRDIIQRLYRLIL